MAARRRRLLEFILVQSAAAAYSLALALAVCARRVIWWCTPSSNKTAWCLGCWARCQPTLITPTLQHAHYLPAFE